MSNIPERIDLITNPSKKQAENQSIVLKRLLKEGHSYPQGHTEWQILSEHMGVEGERGQLDLGVYRGSYRQVCEFAVKLRNFYNYGSGGVVKPFTPCTIRDVGDVEKVKDSVDHALAKLTDSEIELLKRVFAGKIILD